ncbi:VWA domain-containing protein [Actinokineospora soli]|uniref:VWA domain-containing protein n=1 Tax=Actinokineospora soli TaxID=1048753 RepID=A0ABW2TMW0_9PSEU
MTAGQAEVVVQAGGNVRWKHFERVYRYTVEMPRAVRNAVVAVLVSALVAGGAFAVLTWVVPAFAVTYKTLFLLDMSAAGADSEAVAAGIDSLGKAMNNSGDDDAIAVRTFGGECGSESNTTQLVDFGTGNRDEIRAAVSAAPVSGAPTLLRGVIEAAADFSGPLTQDAKQVNRIVVVTRNGVDACDDDLGFVEREMRDRVRAAGLDLEFRFVGYQLDDEGKEGLDKLATGAQAPPPITADRPDELAAALDWVANVEPVLRSAQDVVDVLNPVVADLNEVVQATVDGRLDVAEQTLGGLALAPSVEFDNLRTRAKTPAAVDLHERAVGLRERQLRLVDAARDLLDTARAGEPMAERLAQFRADADAYNIEVDAMNRILAALRAAGPGGRT